MKSKEQTLMVLIGCPASSKTTYRTEFLKNNKEFVAVSRDDFRYMLRNEGWLERGLEDIITQQVHSLIYSLLREGKSIIVDATNVVEKSLIDYNQFLKSSPALRLEYKVFDVPLEELIKRDAARERSVGRAVIEKMFASFDALKKSNIFKKQMDLQDKQAIVQTTTLPPCIIVDMDGTVALFDDDAGPHYRSPFDASRCDEIDYLNVPVAMALRGFVSQGCVCNFVSGREDKYEAPTRRFLEKHFSDIPYNLFMRSSERERGIDDRIVKERIFREEILSKYYTVACIDDRPKVIKAFQSMGLFVFDVNNGRGAF